MFQPPDCECSHLRLLALSCKADTLLSNEWSSSLNTTCADVRGRRVIYINMYIYICGSRCHKERISNTNKQRGQAHEHITTRLHAYNTPTPIKPTYLHTNSQILQPLQTLQPLDLQSLHTLQPLQFLHLYNLTICKPTLHTVKPYYCVAHSRLLQFYFVRCE